MICIECNKNQVTKFQIKQLCNSCYVVLYRRKKREELKKIVFGRDNYCCTKCGSNEDLCVHHIDGNGVSKNNKRLKPSLQNNDINNLITVCRKCHNLIHIKGKNNKSNKWSRNNDECIRCKKTDNPHRGRGLCTSCYEFFQSRTERRKKYKKEWYQKKT